MSACLDKWQASCVQADLFLFSDMLVQITPSTCTVGRLLLHCMHIPPRETFARTYVRVPCWYRLIARVSGTCRHSDRAALPSNGLFVRAWRGRPVSAVVRHCERLKLHPQRTCPVRPSIACCSGTSSPKKRVRRRSRIIVTRFNLLSRPKEGLCVTQ